MTRWTWTVLHVPPRVVGKALVQLCRDLAQRPCAGGPDLRDDGRDVCRAAGCLGLPRCHPLGPGSVREGCTGTEAPDVAYPRFLDGARRAPPEDVGGTMGFEEFLEAVTKPRHRERKRMLDWYGGPFDPEVLDRETIEAGMTKLARRRAIGQAAFAKSRGRP
ncbi:hypothetical protein ACFZ8E_23575 [Methylobacterium sp. HMF5984]|uniref:IS1096 element passenger TnpR family protein n=1 Tax=Methylobacterium sp. HMF5984 TaxID=3367370 RepID=UPI003852CFB6